MHYFKNYFMFLFYILKVNLKKNSIILCIFWYRICIFKTQPLIITKAIHVRVWNQFISILSPFLAISNLQSYMDYFIYMNCINPANISILHMKKRKSKKLRNLTKITQLMIKWALLSRVVIKQKAHTLYSVSQGSRGGEGAQINSIYTLYPSSSSIKMSCKGVTNPCNLWTISNMTHN